MADKLKGKPGFAGWRHAVWVFIKAQLSSYVASLIDFLVTILLVKLSGLFLFVCYFSGLCSWRRGELRYQLRVGISCGRLQKTHVALKYLFVWGGSILLNTWGTFALTEWLTGMHWVDGLLGHYINDVFILSKIIVAILVAFFWNYHLQRVFVYRNHNFGKFIRQYFRD